MGKKGIIILVVLLLLGGGVVWFVLEGRYAVEGGRAPWAVINDRPDVLQEALAAGVDAEQLRTAVKRAAGKGKIAMLETLLEAGASPDPASKGRCPLDQATRFGRVKVARVLLEHGADPALCRETPTTLMANTIVYGAGDVPQAEIKRVLAPLIAAGGEPAADADGQLKSPLQEAERKGLDQVVAYLKDPSAPVAAADGGGERSLGRAGSLELDDLKRVCAGEGLADAAAYVKQPDHAALVYYFERRSDSYRWPGRGPGRPTLPRWWTSWDDPSHTQLVACVDLSDKTKVRECSYKGGGGGFNVYDAKVVFKLYEAKTGELVAEHSFQKAGPGCPMVKSGTKHEGLYPAYSAELKTFLEPHVGGPQ
jgi:hypothetical protein